MLLFVGEIIMDLKIDPEFKSVIPLQMSEDHRLLEESILKNGFDDSFPIIIWNDTVIDGHNRYEICKKHNISFTIKEKKFSNRNEAILYIINIHFRRHMTRDQLKYMIGQRYNKEKEICGLSKEKNIDNNKQDKTLREVQDNNRIIKSIAKDAKVGKNTVKNSEEFYNDINNISKNTGVSIQNLLSEIKCTQKDYKNLSELSPEKAKIVLKKIDNKEVKDIKHAIRELKKDEAKEIQKIEDIKPNKIIIKTEIGKWYILGNHFLYCGSNSDKSFLDEIKKHKIKFVFADPPYNAGTGEDWDKNFKWKLDWLIDLSPVVAVTPGIISVQDFFRTTNMPYVWSVSCWIDNGMTRGAMGFGNWIYIALFAKENINIYKNSQDFVKVSIRNTDEEKTGHRGQKPSNLISWLLDKFTEQNNNILDPFLGSGTTLLVSEKMNRNCIGAEILPEYCDKIISRWEKQTGKEARIL